MRTIENSVALNLQDFVAVTRQVASHLGADLMEVAGGVAAFNGNGSPLTTVKGIGPRITFRDLNRIEEFFRGHSVPAAVIEAAPWLTEETKELLAGSGYEVAGYEDVMATRHDIPAGASTSSLRVEAAPLDVWPELMLRSYELPNDPLMKALATAAASLPSSTLYGVRDHGRWIACAQAVWYGEVVIFGCDGTVREARGRGAQTALIMERLRAVPTGSIVVAEVAPGSVSQRNYLRCGFHLAYSRQHFVRALA